MTNQSHCDLAGFDELTVAIVPFYIIVSIMAIVGNCLVIASVVRFTVLRTPTNNFVVALALADLAVGLTIPFYISFYFNVPYVCHPVACECRYFIALWSTVLSMLLLIGVAVDRYVSIIHPLQYPQLVSHRISRCVILLIFIYVILVTTLPFYWEGAIKDLTLMSECDLYYIYTPVYAAMGVGFHLILSLSTTIVFYVQIFRAACRQNRAVAALHQAYFHQEAKTAIMMVLILGVNIISAVPYLIVVTIRYTEEDAISPDLKVALSQAKKVVVILYFGKSAMNPIIYGWKNQDFRAAFARLLAEIRRFLLRQN